MMASSTPPVSGLVVIEENQRAPGHRLERHGFVQGGTDLEVQKATIRAQLEKVDSPEQDARRFRGTDRKLQRRQPEHRRAVRGVAETEPQLERGTATPRPREHDRGRTCNFRHPHSSRTRATHRRAHRGQESRPCRLPLARFFFPLYLHILAVRLGINYNSQNLAAAANGRAFGLVCGCAGKHEADRTTVTKF